MNVGSNVPLLTLSPGQEGAIRTGRQPRLEGAEGAASSVVLLILIQLWDPDVLTVIVPNCSPSVSQGDSGQSGLPGQAGSEVSSGS